MTQLSDPCYTAGYLKGCRYHRLHSCRILHCGSRSIQSKESTEIFARSCTNKQKLLRQYKVVSPHPSNPSSGLFQTGKWVVLIFPYPISHIAFIWSFFVWALRCQTSWHLFVSVTQRTWASTKLEGNHWIKTWVTLFVNIPSVKHIDLYFGDRFLKTRENHNSGIYIYVAWRFPQVSVTTMYPVSTN